MSETANSVQTEGYLVDLGAVIESSDDGIIAITSSGLIAYCNRAAVLLYGYRGPDLVGADAQVLVPPELRAAEELILRRVARGGRSTSTTWSWTWKACCGARSATIPTWSRTCGWCWPTPAR